MTVLPATEAFLDDRVSPLEDDIFAFEFIQCKKTLAFEVDLMATKWFDYRHMTPLQATRIYIQAFTDAYPRFVREEDDIEKAKVITPTSIDSIFRKLEKGEGKVLSTGKSQMVAAWHGRQAADLMGVPYDVFINKAMEIRLRYWKRRHLPQMMHLYGDLIFDRMPDAWIELQGSKFFFSEHPAYLVQNYCGTRAQDDHHEWLFRQAEMRANKARAIADFIDRDLISYEKVKSRTTVEDFERIASYIN